MVRGRRGRRLILAFHNIVPAQGTPWGERALHLPRSRFQNHLEVLAESCDLVPLEQLLAASPDPGSAPQVAITFDDAYTGALDAVQELLVPNEIAATIFASPGLMGEKGFWWDQLAVAFDGTLPESVRDHCLTELGGDTEAVLSWAREQNIDEQLAPEYARPAGEPQLLDLSRSKGVAVESHTWSHRNLAELSHDEVREELHRARTWVRERGLGPADLVAYPYGLASDAVYRLARSVGHQDGLLVQGGWLPAEECGRTPFAVPRLNVPAGLSPNGLRLRLAGLTF